MANFVLGGCVRVDGVKGNVARVPAEEDVTVCVLMADGTVREVACEQVVRTKGRPKNAAVLQAALACEAGDACAAC